MAKSVAIIGAGVSGLTCGVVFAERGFRTSIFAEQIGTHTTSGAAAALWFPYDAEPAKKVIPWALATYQVLVDLSKDSESGVSMIELRQFCRTGKIQIPDWAQPYVIPSEVGGSLDISVFESGFALRVPLMDTTIYLDYLANRFQKAGGAIQEKVRLEKVDDVDPKFDLVINCAGIGARELARDVDLEPHRGQVAIVPKIDNLNSAIVCDDAPLMYAVPRTNDCVFGGTNEVSDNLAPDPATTDSIVTECSRLLRIKKPRVLRERVGLRPFRKSGVRLEKEKLSDGRTVIHNYGHGGSGLTLSWGCARNVLHLCSSAE
ncbi:MAG TPA: FAD-dependent oxidoreductase [Chthoniobacterales bacterium]|jgi:D-amino-acid oxidase|nr:FAD-dependent oxidoreductase [Chthoniobacterales bacterium]